MFRDRQAEKTLISASCSVGTRAATANLQQQHHTNAKKQIIGFSVTVNNENIIVLSLSLSSFPFATPRAHSAPAAIVRGRGRETCRSPSRCCKSERLLMVNDAIWSSGATGHNHRQRRSRRTCPCNSFVQFADFKNKHTLGDCKFCIEFNFNTRCERLFEHLRSRSSKNR